MPGPNLRALSTALFSAILLELGPVRADPAVTETTQAQARALAVDGRAAFGAGDYDGAVTLFRRAYSLLPAPTISLYEARALVRLGRLVEAKIVYERTASGTVDPAEPEQFKRAVDEAKIELGDVELRIPSVVLTVGEGGVPSELSVYFDGVPVPARELGAPRAADPGQHRAVIRRPGLPDIVRDFTLPEGSTKRVELPLDEATAAPGSPRAAAEPHAGKNSPATRGASPRRVAAYGALGLGAAGLGTGIIAGLVAGGRHSDMESGCPLHACVNGTAGAEALDDFHTLRAVSTAGYVIGLLGLGTGLTLLLTEPRGGQRDAELRLFVGVGSAGLRGSL